MKEFHREKISKAMKEKWQDPKFRQMRRKQRVTWTPHLLNRVKELYGKIPAREIAELLDLPSKRHVYNIVSIALRKKGINVATKFGSFEHRLRLSTLVKKTETKKQREARLKNLSKGWTKTPERRERIRETIRQHQELVSLYSEKLRKDGFKVLPLDVKGSFRPDIIAIKDNKSFAVEVDTGRRCPRGWAKYRKELDEEGKHYFFDEIIGITPKELVVNRFP